MPLPVPPSLGAFPFPAVLSGWRQPGLPSTCCPDGGGPFNTTEYAAALPSWLWVAGTAGVFLLLSLPALRSRHPLDDYYLLGGSLLYGVGLVGSYTGAASYGFVGVVLLALALLWYPLLKQPGFSPVSLLHAPESSAHRHRRMRRPVGGGNGNGYLPALRQLPVPQLRLRPVLPDVPLPEGDAAAPDHQRAQPAALPFRRAPVTHLVRAAARLLPVPLPLHPADRTGGGAGPGPDPPVPDLPETGVFPQSDPSLQRAVCPVSCPEHGRLFRHS